MMTQAAPDVVRPDDPGLVSEWIQFPGHAGRIKGYISRPQNGDGIGSVLVIHENKGLNGHIRDLARRFAKEGFAALAPDLLSRLGGTDRLGKEAEVAEAIKNLSPDDVVEDLTSAAAFIKDQRFANGRLGVVGFCWGGAQALNFATRAGNLNAATVYYGRNPNPLDRVRNIDCPLLGNYGGDDPKILPEIEPLKEALAKHGKVFDIKIYPGAKHAFNNNTNPDRFHPQAARDAWERTTRFFRVHLSG